MNRLVPIFHGQPKCSYSPGCAAGTQKYIGADGKDNDLDDEGLGTYHRTFSEVELPCTGLAGQGKRFGPLRPQADPETIKAAAVRD